MLTTRLPLFPAMRVHASSNFSLELSRHVLTGELDTALVVAHVPDKRLNNLDIASHPLYAVFKATDEAVALASVSLSDFADRVWVVYGRHVHPSLHELLALARKSRIRPRDFHHVTAAEKQRSSSHSTTASPF